MDPPLPRKQALTARAGWQPGTSSRNFNLWTHCETRRTTGSRTSYGLSHPVWPGSGLGHRAQGRPAGDRDLRLCPQRSLLVASVRRRMTTRGGGLSGNCGSSKETRPSRCSWCAAPSSSTGRGRLSGRCAEFETRPDALSRPPRDPRPSGRRPGRRAELRQRVEASAFGLAQRARLHTAVHYYDFDLK